MTTSLRKRLTFTLLGLTLLTWLVSVLATAIHSGQLLISQVDRHLAVYADIAQHSLSAVMEDPIIRRRFQARSELVGSGLTLRRLNSYGDTETGTAVNLWFGRSQILVGQHAPAFPSPQSEGITNYQLEDGSRWRILYQHNPQFNVWRAVGVDLKTARHGGIATFWRGVIPLLIILPVTVGILLFGVRRGLKPLDQLADEISARQLHALEPFDTASVPQELKPVVTSLNDLLDRLHRALASEYRFTANAAHELQTPLAAIQAAVQTCQRRMAKVPECSDIDLLLERISNRVSSAADTVKQLLTLARLDPDQEFKRQPVEMTTLVMDAMADVGDIALERDISIRFDDHAQAWVNGNAEWLRILLRNLFVNAFRYAPIGSEVEITLDEKNGACYLRIGNDCDPISQSEFERLTERFYHPSTGTEHGVGLGLSIVQRIAELHHATLRLKTWKHNRGFLVELRTPTATP